MKFEDALPDIIEQIDKRRQKWKYDLVHTAFEDVKSIILAHIHKKWCLYDPEQPLKNWVNRIISNQLKNLARNHVGIYAPPCTRLKCPEFTADEKCKIYGLPCAKCPLYAKWLKTKKYGGDINLPVAAENHALEIFNMPALGQDLEFLYDKLIEKAKDHLTIEEHDIFLLSFVQGYSDAQIAKIKRYKVFSSNKKQYSKQIDILKNNIINKLKPIVLEGELF